MPETSVIVRTFNEAAFLSDLLAGIRAQRYQDFEIVVVDSGSFDGTVEIAKQSGVRLVEIASRDFTFGYSLNRGIAVSQGRFVALVSAHATPVDELWLGALIEPLRDANVAMTYGRQRGEARSKFSEREDFRRTFGRRRRVIVPPDFFANNANSAVRRDLWDQQPFDEALPGLEDAGWARHWMDRGYQVVYEPTAAIYHIHTETWPQVEHRYFREAIAAHAMGLRGRHDIPLALLGEAGRLTADVGVAFFRDLRPGVFPEIARFRWAKARGTVRGFLDRSEAQVVVDHQGFFFKEDVAAVVVSSPGHASLKMVTLPEVKPGDVVVRVEYVGICGTDLEVFRGSLGYFSSGRSTYPITPGHEVSGTVVRTGPNARATVQVGDHVVVECIQGCGACPTCSAGEPIRCADRKELGVMRLNGGYAKHIVVAAEHVHRIPDTLDLQRAALCEPLAVAMKGRRRLLAALGDGPHHIGIIGAGSLGQLLSLVLALEGHQVSLVDLRESRLEAARRALPDAGLSSDPSSLWRCDAIAEVTGQVDVLEAVLGGVGVGRVVLLLGFPYGKLEFDPEWVVSSDISLVGSVGSGPADFREALQVLPRLAVDEFLKSTFPLHAYEEAWAAQTKGERLKVMLHVSG